MRLSLNSEFAANPSLRFATTSDVRPSLFTTRTESRFFCTRKWTPCNVSVAPPTERAAPRARVASARLPNDRRTRLCRALATRRDIDSERRLVIVSLVIYLKIKDNCSECDPKRDAGCAYASFCKLRIVEYP